jgi:hypothetical protein
VQPKWDNPGELIGSVPSAMNFSSIVLPVPGTR